VFTESKNDVPAEKRPKSSEVCLACHGTNGVGITPDYPTISGQHRDYLARALTDYQRGGRKNAIMAGMTANLTREDIDALAAYYAGQKPALQVVPRNVSFLSSK
jgi:cytochrome c553